MAEALVSSILEQLLSITLETARKKLKLGIGVDEEVEKLKRNFENIHGVLQDAEEKQFVERNVKSWLDKLKEVSYDMDDVLDEWKTSLPKLQTDGVKSDLTPKKRATYLIYPVLSFPRRVVRRHDIGKKIQQINEVLDEIDKEKDRYHFARREITQPRRLEGTTSYIDVSKIRGRDDIRDEMLHKLSLTSEEDCFQTISIIGMGGIGKTALAQLVFNHIRRQNTFDKTVWVCVSDFFDPIKVAREILEGLDPNSLGYRNLITRQSLLDNISEKIKEIKLFLVFDDVWTDRDEYWQELRAALQHCKHGSRILVTTRKESVVKVVRSSHVFPLELLSDEICWDILKQVAFFGRNMGEFADLEDVGMEIARKCKGLPLAAKTLGSLLRFKRRRREWEKVLNSRLWELKIAEEYIFRPLLLSYYDLPSTIRQCLLYCAIFPKDYEMSRDDLILHWKVQGFLNFDEDSDMESQGEEYFRYLASRSFFQDFAKDTSGNIYKCKMHDLIHDFLLFMTKDEIVQKEVKSDAPLSLDSGFKKARHLRITIGQRNTLPESINGVEKLRSLIIIGQESIVTREAIKNLFDKTKCLRLLQFEFRLRSTSRENVPLKIENLIHLRYLRFGCCCNFRSYVSVYEMQNLQYLDFSHYVGLRELPDGMEELINLKYLYTRGCVRLNSYPKGIGRLTGLKRLDRVIARVDRNDTKEFSIGDLENLDLLCGDLQMLLRGLCGNSFNREEVERAKLKNKIHLNRLYLTWHVSEGEPGQKISDDLIEALNPPSNLGVQFDSVLGFTLLKFRV